MLPRSYSYPPSVSEDVGTGFRGGQSSFPLRALLRGSRRRLSEPVLRRHQPAAQPQHLTRAPNYTSPYTLYLHHPSPSILSFNHHRTLLAHVEVSSPPCSPALRPGLPPRPELSGSPRSSPGAMSPPMLPAPSSRRPTFPLRMTSLSQSASPTSPSRLTSSTRPHTPSTPPRRS